MSSPGNLSLVLLLFLSLYFLSSSFSYLSRGEEVQRGVEEEKEQKKREDAGQNRTQEKKREDREEGRGGGGGEEEAEEKSRMGNETSLSLQDLIQSSLLVLDQLTPELSLKNSPLSIQSTQEEEDQLDKVDEGFSEREKLLKIIACFRLTQRHHAANGDTYKSLLQNNLSPKYGMREDEILKVVFHGAWVACHHNLRQEHSGLLARLISGEKLSTAEEYSLLYRHPRRTPFRFSKKQHNFAEQTIRRFGRDSPSVHMAINGWRGYVYSFLVLTFIFFCLLYIYRTLKRRARRRKSASHQEAAKKSKLSSSSRGVGGVEEGEEREREIFIETGEERGSGAGMSLTSLKSGRNAKASQKQRKTAGRSTPPLTERNEGI